MSNGNNDEDDKPTVVLNLAELKKQNLLNGDVDPETMAQNLEFSATVDLTLDPDNDVEEKPTLLLFDYSSQFFNTNHSFFSEGGECQIVSDLKILNQHITKNKDWYFVFYYNDAPKPVNQLLGQINKKFPALKTVLVANNLAPDKAQQHAKTPSAAKSYLSWPSTGEKLKDCLK